MLVENQRGLALAITSSLFIGSSFIIKKKGLKRAGSSGVRAGVGGYSYLQEPLWWAGMVTMIVGEIANFTAYAFAPAVLVTPLGALSIIVSATLAHWILKEKLHIFGIVGCVLCIVGSTTIVLHAPEERAINSVTEVWDLATDPYFLLYTLSVAAVVLLLIFHYVPRYGHTHVLVYVGICSLMGSLSVMSVKALGIALKLTAQGDNQFVYGQTYGFAIIVVTCVVTQINYLNKALDTFNTAVVSPIYYVMFTSLTILASAIMFKDWDRQTPTQIVTELCGFITILTGTFLLHATKDMVDPTTGASFHGGIQSSGLRFTDWDRQTLAHVTAELCGFIIMTLPAHSCFIRPRIWWIILPKYVYVVESALHESSLLQSETKVTRCPEDEKDSVELLYAGKNASEIRDIFAFITVLTGTFLLHSTKDMVDSSTGTSLIWWIQPSITHRISIGTGISRCSEDEASIRVLLGPVYLTFGKGVPPSLETVNVGMDNASVE